MKDNGKYPWKICFCGVVTDYYQEECPMKSTCPGIFHNLQEIKLSTGELRELNRKRLIIASDHSNPQIVELTENKKTT